MVGFGKYTCMIYDFIRDILELTMEPWNADDSQIVVNTDIYFATKSISKSRYPFQIIVFPDTLMLDVLILLIHRTKIVITPDVHKTLSKSLRGGGNEKSLSDAVANRMGEAKYDKPM